MTQELSIVIMIDVQAALNAETLEGHIYLVDNLRTEGSEHEGTGYLISAVNGSHWVDGSQASEQLINWLPYSITCLSPSLPRFYAQDRRKTQEKKVLNQLRNRSRLVPENDGNNESPSTISMASTDTVVPAVSALVDDQDRTIASRIALIDLKGNLLSGNGKRYEKLIKNSNTLGGANSDVSDISYLAPHLYNITGEAVKKGVIYPAQYGTPTPVKGGWYWCAAVNTCMVGVYSYTMHITLYKPQSDGKEVVWKPVNFTYDAKIKITSYPVRNGFTNAGIGMLPVL